MKKPKRRHYAVAVLAVVVAAFTVDRVWLSSGDDVPRTAAAADAATPHKPAPSLQKTPSKAPDLAVKPETLLAVRLQVLALQRGLGEKIRDAFQPSVRWIVPKVDPGSKADPPKADGGQAVDADPVQAFQQRYKLSAVLVGSRSGAAVVSNTLLRVGQKLDGFRLTQIRRNSVVFVSPDGRNAVLYLEGANPDPSGN
jgi:hypothetical protein